MFSALITSFGLASRGLVVASASAGALTLGLALPALGLHVWSTAYADRVAVSFAGGLSSALHRVLPTPPEAGEPAEESESQSEGPLARVQAPAQGAKKARALTVPLGRRVAHGVRVSSAQVLALANRRAMPRAVPVKATAEHPAGLRLSGVSALGVGLQDGDVLTEAAGQKVASVATVIGIVLAARGRQVPEISGRFYRGWVPFALVVEQPYPPAPLPG